MYMTGIQSVKDCAETLQWAKHDDPGSVKQVGLHIYFHAFISFVNRGLRHALRQPVWSQEKPCRHLQRHSLPSSVR